MVRRDGRQGDPQGPGRPGRRPHPRRRHPEPPRGLAGSTQPQLPDPAIPWHAVRRSANACWRARRATAGTASPSTTGKWQAVWCDAGSSTRGHQRRLLGGADLLRLPAAGAEAAAGRRVDRARHVARSAGSARAAPCRAGRVRAPAPPTAARSVYGCTRPARRASSRSAISTILPRYMTATRSEMCRTTDRSWAMNT